MISLVGAFAQTFDIAPPFVWQIVDEPTNPFDSSAVYITLNGVRAGYVPRQFNRQYRSDTHTISEAQLNVVRGAIAIHVGFHAKQDAEAIKSPARKLKRKISSM